jgi:hypothetical protein
MSTFCPTIVAMLPRRAILMYAEPCKRLAAVYDWRETPYGARSDRMTGSLLAAKG